MNPIKKFLIQRRLKKLEQYEKKLETMHERQAEQKTKTTPPAIKELRQGIKGDFIQKDASISIVILVVVCILIIVGLTLLYQTKFKTLNTQVQNKIAELNSAYETITKKENELQDKQSRLTITEAGKDDLETQYQDVKNDVATLEQDKEQLEETIATINQQLQQLQEQKESLEKENRKLRDRIDDLENP
ncbi:MAG TPA: hypothetical protein VJB87_02785 [Candidatus Nanoarchaeia archaeon]|nr:hypothetical protein [Candidatus Nanoarchaeia archaeon]